MNTQNTKIPATNDDSQPIEGKIGPFEFAGFRGDKFENHEDNADRIESLSDSDSVKKAFQRFRSIGKEIRAATKNDE